MAAVVEVSPSEIPAIRECDRSRGARTEWCRAALDAAAASSSGAVEVTGGVDGRPFATTHEAVRHAGYLRNHGNDKPEYRGLRVKQRKCRLFIVKEDQQ